MTDWVKIHVTHLPVSHEVEVQDPRLQLPSYLESTTQGPEYNSINAAATTTTINTTNTTTTTITLWYLTLSPPIPLRLYTLPYWSNKPFLIFDIRALWRSGLSARAPECQKLKN